MRLDLVLFLSVVFLFTNFVHANKTVHLGVGYELTSSEERAAQGPPHDQRKRDVQVNTLRQKRRSMPLLEADDENHKEGGQNFNPEDVVVSLVPKDRSKCKDIPFSTDLLSAESIRSLTDDDKKPTIDCGSVRFRFDQAIKLGLEPKIMEWSGAGIPEEEYEKLKVKYPGVFEKEEREVDPHIVTTENPDKTHIRPAEKRQTPSSVKALKPVDMPQKPSPVKGRKPAIKLRHALKKFNKNSGSKIKISSKPKPIPALTTTPKNSVEVPEKNPRPVRILSKPKPVQKPVFKSSDPNQVLPRGSTRAYIKILRKYDEEDVKELHEIKDPKELSDYIAKNFAIIRLDQLDKLGLEKKVNISAGISEKKYEDLKEKYPKLFRVPTDDEMRGVDVARKKRQNAFFSPRHFKFFKNRSKNEKARKSAIETSTIEGTLQTTPQNVNLRKLASKPAGIVYTTFETTTIQGTSPSATSHERQKRDRHQSYRRIHPHKNDKKSKRRRPDQHQTLV